MFFFLLFFFSPFSILVLSFLFSTVHVDFGGKEKGWNMGEGGYVKRIWLGRLRLPSPFAAPFRDSVGVGGLPSGVALTSMDASHQIYPTLPRLGEAFSCTTLRRTGTRHERNSVDLPPAQSSDRI